MRSLRRDERGFTLPEVLVSMVVFSAVLFALYALFDASVAAFGAGREGLEAEQNARAGLARIERELRAAYPLDKANGNTALLASFGPDHVTFGNDVPHNDRKPNRRVLGPDGSWESREKIQYRVSNSGVPLRNGDPLVDTIKDPEGKALTFEYFDAGGYPAAGGEESEVALVRVTLRIAVGGAPGTQPTKRVLGTSVALRNR